VNGCKDDGDISHGFMGFKAELDLFLTFNTCKKAVKNKMT